MANECEQEGRVFKEAKDREMSILEKIEELASAGEMNRARILIDELRDKNIRERAFSVLENPYDKAGRRKAKRSTVR